MLKEVFQRVLDQVPDYKTVLTNDEMDASSERLAKEHPECVELIKLCDTRAGKPLYCLKIGRGRRNALFLGAPHPNEPIGSMLLEYFAGRLAGDKELQDELDYTCYIVKAWDRDGMVLNEGWFKGPFTITNYARNFYRPTHLEQVDWTFPIDYKDLHFHKPIPETAAVMKLMDEIKPEFLYTLHNSGFGGVYWYISRDMPEIADDLRAAAEKQQVPLDMGEPEMPWCELYSPAVYRLSTIEDKYDYMEKSGLDRIGERIIYGTCSGDYSAKNFGTQTILNEMPYFFDPRIEDMSESEKTLKEVVLERLEFEEESNGSILSAVAAVKKYVSPSNLFLRMIEEFSSDSSREAAKKQAETDPMYLRKASVAEEFSALLINKFYKMLSFGVLLRMHESTLADMKAKGEDDPEKFKALEEGRKNAKAMFYDLAETLEKEINYEVVPLKKLITIQLTSGFLTMEYLKEH